MLQNIVVLLFWRTLRILRTQRSVVITRRKVTGHISNWNNSSNTKPPCVTYPSTMLTRSTQARSAVDVEQSTMSMGRSISVKTAGTKTTETAMLDSTSEVTISVELPITKESFRRDVLTLPQLVKEKA